MCIIVDANIASNVFANTPLNDFIPIRNWLFNSNKDGKIVAGGKLSIELSRKAQVSIRTLNQAGRARIIPNDEIKRETNNILRNYTLESDDPHILALARVSGARTLCTYDRNLEKDFKNKDIINNQRGNIYKYSSHIALLKHTRSCGQ